jgi:ribosome-associated heat shock protein Hsp15
MERHRLDRWLWFARFYKTRSLATQAVTSGRVKVNDARVKPAHEIRVGDRLSLSLDRDPLELDVLALPPRRGPASEAQACYAETAASIARRALSREQRRLAAMNDPQPDARPDKRERRLLDRLRRQQG